MQIVPNNTYPKVLNVCSDQLSFILTYIFNMSIRTCCVPHSLKNSCIVLLPKKPVCQVMNDLRPVPMTSSIMKVFERLMLNRLQ